MEFLNSLEPLLKTLWFIAIPTSIIFLIQATMTFAGMDSSDGVNADFDSNLDHTEAPFQLFSLRNLIHFLLGFSWTGISFYNSISNTTVLLILSFVVGVSFVVAFFFIITQIQRLAENNSFRIENTINQIGTVYLTIPERKSGKGKVQVSVRGSFHELDAITEKEKIESSAMVRITKIESSNLVVVERI
jgi:hypothetical protein